MFLCNIERVKDNHNKHTHEATITVKDTVDSEESREFRASFFPYMPLGVIFEEQTMFVGGKVQKVYFPVDLGTCAGKIRPQGDNMNSEGMEVFTLDRVQDDVKFYYSLKEFLSYSEILIMIGRVQKNVYREFIRNPYAMVCEMRASDEDYFRLFPELAKTVIPRTFDERLQEYRYGAKFLMHRTESQGDTWISYTDFKKNFLRMFDRIGRPMRYGSPWGVLQYFSDDFIVEPGDDGDYMVFLRRTFRKELLILQVVDQYRNAVSPFPSFMPTDMEGLEDEQKNAIVNSITCRGRISIITGGPGVGKTTVLRKVISTMQEQYSDVEVRFLASTGKAANRIRETIGGNNIAQISTVHKFLGRGSSGYYSKKTNEDIKKAGLIIVDESSMTDIDIFSDLLNRLDMQKTKVILVGDKNQLPSVAAGNVLGDLIDLGVPCYYLTKNHRNSGCILENANRILEGNVFLKEDDSFRIVDRSPSIGWIRAGFEVAAAEKNNISGNEDIPQRDLAAFSPYRKENIKGSAYFINKMAQNSIFRGGRSIRNFYIGDRVIFTRTDYRAGYFNGDIGILTGYKDGYYYVSVDEEVKTVQDVEDIELAYSITIHKSQGSEYDEIVITIPKYSRFITRRMLYTAVTRARLGVTIYASRSTLRRIIMNDSDRNRKTYMAVVANRRKLAAAA